MRRTAIQQVYTLAQHDARICFIGSDLGFGVMDDFAATLPERLFREGVSEQHVIGMAAGLALEGKVVYVNTIASFITRRCYEQIVLDLCMNKAKVRLLGSGGGLVYAPLGPTHLAPDDMAMLRPLPHMTILAPCDAQEMARLMPLTVDVDGPVYVRFAKGGDQIVSLPDAHYAIGKAVSLLPQTGPTDVLLLTTGISAQIALHAAHMLQGQGLCVEILHFHTVKPLDTQALLEAATRTTLLVSVEEHVLTGGLGSAVGECLLDADLSRLPRVRRIGLPDSFFSEHGSQADIMAAHGVTAEQLVRICMALRD